MKCAFLLFLLLCPALTAEDAILSAYCAGPCCCTPFPGKVFGQTASGKQAKQGHTLAMPRIYAFGTKVYLDGKLLGVCEDRGGAIKMQGKTIRIDVFFSSHQEALKFGKRKAKVTILKG